MTEHSPEPSDPAVPHVRALDSSPRFPILGSSEELRAELRTAVNLRYVFVLSSIAVLYLFREHLPFPYPALMLVAIAHVGMNLAVHVLSGSEVLLPKLYIAGAYIDALALPFTFHYSGGFLSPLLLSSFVSALGSAILSKRDKAFGVRIVSLNLAAYAIVALLHKFGVLHNHVGYSRELMAETPFFWYTWLSVCGAYAGGLMVVTRHLDWHVGELRGSYQQIVDGTSSRIGHDYFRAVTESTARALQVRCAVLSEICGEARFKVRSAWCDGREEGRFEWGIDSDDYTRLQGEGRIRGGMGERQDGAAAPAPATLGFAVRDYAGVMLYDSGGGALGALWVFHDRPIAAGTTVEPLLRIFASRLAAELERQRIQEEHEAVAGQVSQLQKMQAVGQLAGGIAHDFNNISQGILGYVWLLSKKAAADPNLNKYGKYMDRIAALCKRAGELTQKLLVFARRGEHNAVVVDLSRCLASVTSLLEHTVDRRIAIRTESAPDRPALVMGDPTQLENALLNIGLNARDAMPDGGELSFCVEIIETLPEHSLGGRSSEMPQGPYVAVRIADTGTGMSDEVRQHAFEPFFTTKERGKGTGLGLASVYGCVMQHKGGVAVKSTVGQGTEFTIYLPLYRGEQVAAQPVGAAVEDSLPGLRVMVVDDEEAIREALGEYLEDRGASAVTFGDPVEAVEYFRGRHESIDVVVLDMLMPHMDGRETFRAMKAISPSVRAILVTGYGIGDAGEELLAGGVAAILRKPLEPSDLAAEILRVSAPVR